MPFSADALVDLVALRDEHGLDGVFFSNGPGDPGTAAPQVALLQRVLAAKLPFFGICFGNQLLGRALGFQTYKLKYGHRGINQPVLDRRTGRVEITSHNHGFAIAWPGAADGQGFDDVRTMFGLVRVSHCLLYTSPSPRD